MCAIVTLSLKACYFIFCMLNNTPINSEKNCTAVATEYHFEPGQNGLYFHF